LETSYVTFYDISIAVIWLIIFLIISNSRRKAIEDLDVRKYYLRNVLFKFFFSISFAIIYLIYYGGGDTTAYWDGALTLNNLFFKSPSMYFEHLFSEPTKNLLSAHFDIDTGYPPGWIYREPEAWFICKLGSLVSFFTFKSYFAASLFFAFFSAMASWRLFELILKLNTHKINVAAWCVLFIPSVSFWCTGISKDTIVFICILNILYYVFDIMVLKNNISVTKVIILILCIYLIYQIRTPILASIALPLFMAYGARLTRKYERNFIAKLFLRSLILFGGIFVFLQFFASDFAENMVNEAQIVQQDFIKNETYTGKRYEISNTDASPQGLLKAVPESVISGVFRPFFWESLSPTLILNGVESLILMFLTIKFILNRNVFSRLKKIRKEEILVFAFIFSLFIAFMAGFTSVLFGVLVRIRAPLLIFLFLVLTFQITTSKRSENNEKK